MHFAISNFLLLTSYLEKSEVGSKYIFDISHFLLLTSHLEKWKIGDKKVNIDFSSLRIWLFSPQYGKSASGHWC